MSERRWGTPMTVLVKPDLEAIIRQRAGANGRTISKELVVLIETALAIESEDVRKALHLLFKAEVEVTDDAANLQPA